MKIHKAGPQKVSMYVGLGRYEYVPAPLCVGAKAVYEGKSYLIHRLKSKVTCKHCLRKLLTQQARTLTKSISKEVNHD